MFKNIILYGAGKRAQTIIKILELCKLSINFILDSDPEKWGKNIGGYRIESPDVLIGKSDYLLCITVADGKLMNEIRKMLQQDYLFDPDNEIYFEELIVKAYERISYEQLGLNTYPANSKEKTIIFDCESGLVLGGIEEWTKGICAEFVKKNEYKSYILTDFGDYEIPEELENNILRVDVKSEDRFLPDNILKLADCIIQNMPCILVSSQPNEVLLTGHILKSYYQDNIQIISGIRGGSEEIYSKYYAMRNCTDLYVCVSSDIQKNMVKRGINEDKALVMICPMECPDILNRNYTVDVSKPIRIGYAGRIVVEQKRMDLLLKLISELEVNNVNYHLELAGEGDYETEIEDFVNKERLHNKVKLLGRLDKNDIPKFWKDKDICMNIADYEGRSRSIAEAMANGAIPVVTNTSGVNDDIRDGENGYIVDIGDYVLMAERIKYLDEHRNLLESMGNMAHAEIKQKSSMEDHYQFWKKIIS